MGRAKRGRRGGAAAARAVATVAAGVAIAATTLLGVAACGPPPPPEPVAGDVFAASLGVDLSEMERTDSGLYVQTVRPGNGAVARAGQRARVHYEGWFVDGTKFDSSRDRGEPLEVPLGMDIAIDAWDEGVVGMRVGEIRRLVAPPYLAYGAEGVTGAIPPDAVLVFEIELLGVH